MQLEYKNFILKQDDYCWALIQKVEYEKQDGLHGEKTGEIGVKENVIGYYPSNKLDIVLIRMLDFCLPEDISTIQQYLLEYNNSKEELKQYLNGVTIKTDSSN